MKRDPLAVPLRLARHAVDRARQRLEAAGAARHRLEQALDRLRGERGAAPAEDAPGLQLLGHLAERSRLVERRLQEQLGRARDEQAARLRELTARRLGLEQLERLDARRRQRARAVDRRREDATLGPAPLSRPRPS